MCVCYRSGFRVAVSAMTGRERNTNIQCDVQSLVDNPHGQAELSTTRVVWFIDFCIGIFIFAFFSWIFAAVSRRGGRTGGRRKILCVFGKGVRWRLRVWNGH